MKKISANYVFPGNSSPIKNGVIFFDSKGTIITVLDPKKEEINWKEVGRLL